MFKQPREARSTEKTRCHFETREVPIQKILEAAEHIFSLIGYNGTTIEKLAEQSALSKQNLLCSCLTQRHWLNITNQSKKASITSLCALSAIVFYTLNRQKKICKYYEQNL